MKELYASHVEQIALQRMVYGLSPLVTYLKEQDIDCTPFFSAANIASNSIGDPSATMDLRQELSFTLAAIKALGVPGLGLAIGPRYHLSTFGMLGLAMMSSDTLHKGLHTLSGLHGLCWTRLRWRQLVDGDTAILEGREVESLDPCQRYMLERDFSALVILCNEMLGTELPLQEVCFSYSQPTNAAQYEAVFNCPVRFGAERSALIFDASVLDTPLPQANPTIFQVCYTQCEDLVARLSGENSYAEMIECLMIDGTGNFLSLEQVAVKLHLSPRSLRRRLKEEDTSFQALLTRLRSTLAKELLLSGKLTIEQVAERIGYSEPAAFCHAFKRWTGMPPSRYR
ncbi:MAG: AraC family transcriptional regulator [Pseudomonadales bacterium]